MANPYTSQAISGYNTSPPPDDGSQTSANTVRWATHKSKLADPIKTLSEAINSELIAAFGKIHGNDVLVKSGNYSVGASDIGKVIDFDTGSSTLTLIAVATAGIGFPLTVINTSSGIVTIDGNSSELISTVNGNVTSFALQPGQAAFLTCNGSIWTSYRISPGPEARSGTNKSWTSDDVLADVTGLTGFFLAASGEYQFECYLHVTQSGGDFKFAFNSDGGYSVSNLVWFAADESGNADQGFLPVNITNTQSVTGMTDTEAYGLRIIGQLTASSVSTNFRMSGAQAASFSIATTVSGVSWMKVRRIQ